MPFKRMKAFFSKKYAFLIKICSFSKFKNFLIFLQKTLTFQVVKTLSRNNVYWYTFYSKFATFTDFEKIIFFQKTQHFFSKKEYFLYLFEKSYCFSRIQRQICFDLMMKNFLTQNLPWQLVNKRNKTQRVEWIFLLPYYEYGQKIIISPHHVVKIKM